MKTSGTGRVLSTLFLGVMFGIYIHFRQMRDLALGRDAYLAAQSRWFGNVAAHHATAHMVVAGILLAAIAVGVYELIARGFTKMIPPTEVEG